MSMVTSKVKWCITIIVLTRMSHNVLSLMLYENISGFLQSDKQLGKTLDCISASTWQLSMASDEDTPPDST